MLIKRSEILANRMRSREFSILLLNIVSFAILLVVVVVNIVVWQINYAGYNVDIVTSVITRG